MSMDISGTLAPKSDQQNYEDYISGPKTVTISGVSQGSPDQPVNIELAEFPGRPFKPAKTVRRILVSAWGPDASQYVGRRMTLFGDASVKWAGEAVGGIRVSHLSHIDKPVSVALTVTRGKRQKHTVQPLPDAPEPATEPWLAQWRAISNALTTAGYEGDGQALLATAGQVIGAEWSHPNQISPEDAQKILAAVREETTDQ